MRIAEVLDLKPRRVRSYIKKMVTLGGDGKVPD